MRGASATVPSEVIQVKRKRPFENSPQNPVVVRHLRAKRPSSPLHDDEPDALLRTYVIEYVPQKTTASVVSPGESTEEAVVVMRVARRHLTTESVAFQQRQLWGTDVYTEDSDVPCMLQHTGNFILTANEPGTERLDYLLVRLRVVRYHRGMPCFESSHRNGIRSRCWGSVYNGLCMSIMHVATVKNGKETILANPVAALLRPYIPHLVWSGVQDSAPLSADVPVTFDLLNEACLCYNIAAVADSGTDESLWPRWRLASEVMYLESATERFELAALVPQAHVGGQSSVESEKSQDLKLRLARLRKDTLNKLRLQGSFHAFVGSGGKGVTLTTPLPASSVEIIAEGLTWSDLQWTSDGLTVNGKHLVLRKLAYKPVNS